MLCRSCGLRASSSSLLRRVAVSSFTCLHGISQRSIASQSTGRLSHSDHNGSAAHEQLPRVPQKQQQQQQLRDEVQQLQLQPRICESIAEAEAAVEDILAQTMESARERLVDAELAGSSVQLSLLLQLADSFWRSAQTSVYVPRNIYAMDDFGVWLLKVLRSSFGPRRLHEDNAKSPNTSRFASMDDDAVMQEFDEWVETCMAEQRVSCTSATAELLPYTMLMDVVHAYIRYHKGVAWGVSSANTAKDDEERGSFYRRRYLLHPWFRVDCPDGPAAQLPHVHVLQWMRSSSTTREASGSSSALTTFTPPSLHRGNNNNNMNDEVGFAALDLCSQSGHVTELLLKAGATRVVAVDATTEAVGNTESTVHDVQRERRSSSRATVEVLQSPFLPFLSSTSTAAAKTAQEKLVEPANTFFAAAQRRRRLGHRQRWGSEATTTPPSEPTSFDVIYVHPPLPSLVPFDAHAGRGGSLVGLRSSASASDAARHPHATRETLQRLASHFRGEVEDASPSSSSPLLLTGGYLVFVLPRSYDIHDLLCSVGGGMRGTLAEDVLRELGDAFELVQHRAMRGIESNSSSHAWLRYAVDQLRWGRENLQHMERLLRSRIMIDVLIVKKLASSARAPSRQKSSSSSLPSQRPTCVGEDVDVHGIAWEDSAEYDEYKPRSCHAPTQFHWSDRMPSYGFLQDDYVSPDVVLEQGERRSHNVLAHGFASPLPSHGTTISASMSGAAVQRLPTAVAASSRFQSIFAAELRTTRRRKLRKLATAPIHQQEWFIDEKLIKSEAAKVDFMNELSKWDLQDYDD